MTKYQQILSELAREAREWATCQSSICSRNIADQGVCETCQDFYVYDLTKSTILLTQEEALLLAKAIEKLYGEGSK